MLLLRVKRSPPRHPPCNPVRPVPHRREATESGGLDGKATPALAFRASIHLHIGRVPFELPVFFFSYFTFFTHTCPHWTGPTKKFKCYRCADVERGPVRIGKLWERNNSNDRKRERVTVRAPGNFCRRRNCDRTTLVRLRTRYGRCGQTRRRDCGHRTR